MSRPGYHGCYLRIDLTTQTSSRVPIPDHVVPQFIGGSGLGTWILLRETPDHVDPFDPDVPLIFAFSPLVGSPLTTSAKFAVVTKSPLTLRINDSLASSRFALSGKGTGHDAIVVCGRATGPTVLIVTPDSVRFEDAAELSGKTVSATEAELRRTLGPGYQSAVIGPAGENRVHYASISHDGRHAGRGGAGAVMGARNLKALCVTGNLVTPFADPDGLLSYSRELSRRSLDEATAKYRELGTVDNLVTFNRLGTLPTRNFQAGEFAEADRLSPQTLSVGGRRTRTSCAKCTIGCEHIFEASDGRRVRMEYENLFALGPLCGISDPDTVLRASSLCDDLGLDTISTGVTIAFAMECRERGLLDEPELRFGNGPAVLSVIREIAARRGVGELLSLGTRAASAEIGQGSERFAAHVKGLELPGYEPRALQMMGLGFAVNARGADHNRSGAYQVDFSEAVNRFQVSPEQVHLAIETENEAAAMDSLILCKFLRGVFDDRMEAMAEMLRLVTGMDVSSRRLVQSACTIVDAKKLFNLRQGWTPAEDTLPARFLEETLTEGGSAGAGLTREHLSALVRAYNLARGWSKDGQPDAGRVASLDALLGRHTTSTDRVDDDL